MSSERRVEKASPEAQPVSLDYNSSKDFSRCDLPTLLLMPPCRLAESAITDKTFCAQR